VIRLFLTLLFFASLILSCKQKQDLKYFYISYRDREYQRADTNIVFKIKDVKTNDTIKICYYSQRDTISYIFLKQNRDSSKIIGSYVNDGRIRPVLDTTVIVEKDTFNVTEYISDEFVADGSSIHYYTPQLGVFTTHSGTWPGIRFLQTSDSSINRKIIKLLKATVPDFFIRGKLANDL
jgi:hypothetical protein